MTEIPVPIVIVSGELPVVLPVNYVLHLIDSLMGYNLHFLELFHNALCLCSIIYSTNICMFTLK